MKTRFARASFALFLAGVVSVAGCGGGEGTQTTTDTTATDTTMQQPQQQTEAYARLHPVNNSNVHGTVTFAQEDGGVRVVARVNGLTPGQHGFHVHENGDCGNNAEAAGGHFAPQGSPHGAPDNPDGQRHIGDLGNLEVGSDSSATYERADQVLALSGPNSIVGKAVIVHAAADDLQTQPSGNAGPRVACGVVELGQGNIDDMMNGGTGGMPGDTAGTTQTL